MSKSNYMIAIINVSIVVQANWVWDGHTAGVALAAAGIPIWWPSLISLSDQPFLHAARSPLFLEPFKSLY